MTYFSFLSDYHGGHSQLLFERIISYPLYTAARLKCFRPSNRKHHRSYRVAIVPRGSYLYTGPVCAGIYFLLDQYTSPKRLIIIGSSGYNDAIIRTPESSYKGFSTGLGKRILIDNIRTEQHIHNLQRDSNIFLHRNSISIQMPYIAALTTVKKVVPLLIGSQVNPDDLSALCTLDHPDMKDTAVIICANMGQQHNEEELIRKDSDILASVLHNYDSGDYITSLDISDDYPEHHIIRCGIEYSYQQQHYLDCFLYSRDEETPSLFRSYVSFIG